MKANQFILFLTGSAMLGLAPLAANAQTWPERPMYDAPMMVADSNAEPRHEQIENERKAQEDQARGDYRTTRQHYRAARADQQVREAQRLHMRERRRHKPDREL